MNPFESLFCLTFRSSLSSVVNYSVKYRKLSEIDIGVIFPYLQVKEFQCHVKPFDFKIAREEVLLQLANLLPSCNWALSRDITSVLWVLKLVLAEGNNNSIIIAVKNVSEGPVGAKHKFQRTSSPALPWHVKSCLETPKTHICNCWNLKVLRTTPVHLHIF